MTAQFRIASRSTRWLCPIFPMFWITAAMKDTYDHNFVINKFDNELGFAGKVESEKSGIKMDVYTTEPGVQFYTGNYLDGSLKGKSGNYEQRSGFCLETQHFPDSPHFEKFPTTVLKKGDIFRSETIYRFYL